MLLNLNLTKNGNKNTLFPPNTFSKESTGTGMKSKVKPEMQMKKLI